MPSLVSLIPPQIICGNAEPILVRGNPHLLTCAHLVTGAVRMMYNGAAIGFAIKCVDSANDLAIIEWHVTGRQNFRDVADPDFDPDVTAPEYVAAASGDCGRGIGEPVARLVGSAFVPMRRNAVWRIVTAYTSCGLALPHVRIPRIIGYCIAAVDSCNGPAAYSYLGCKFPGDEVHVAYVRECGARFVAGVRLMSAL